MSIFVFLIHSHWTSTTICRATDDDMKALLQQVEDCTLEKLSNVVVMRSINMFSVYSAFVGLDGLCAMPFSKDLPSLLLTVKVSTRLSLIALYKLIFSFQVWWAFSSPDSGSRSPISWRTDHLPRCCEARNRRGRKLLWSHSRYSE